MKKKGDQQADFKYWYKKNRKKEDQQAGCKYWYRAHCVCQPTALSGKMPMVVERFVFVVRWGSNSRNLQYDHTLLTRECGILDRHRANYNV